MSPEFQPDERLAQALDEQDPLARFRSRFHLPCHADGRVAIYFAGNSLGLQPKEAARAVQRELDQWASLGVDAHFDGPNPWYSYHEILRDPLARLVGAGPHEVVAMNGLTVNLHLMFVSFYRPTSERHKILMEDHAFPSDNHAVRSQLRYHGFDPDDALLVARAREGESALRSADVLELIERRGAEIALVLLGGINFYTGQLFELELIARAARRQGCVVGFDLAHAVGNVPLRLHDWGVDFAVWCGYKYLNGGPGAAAGCFVHESRASEADLPRFAGWWGHDPGRRFRMQLETEFLAQPGADGWQVSNPPILALAPLAASLAIFDDAGFDALCAKSRKLTAYLAWWIERAGGDRIELLTPRDPDARGCQLSIRVAQGAEALFRALRAAGVVGDFRPPDVIRVAPVPLFNTFHEVWQFGQALLA